MSPPRCTVAVSLPARATLLHAGDPASYLAIVVSGELQAPTTIDAFINQTQLVNAEDVLVEMVLFRQRQLKIKWEEEEFAELERRKALDDDVIEDEKEGQAVAAQAH